MHTTLQQDGRSPRSMNSPTTSQVKDGKGRKRDRGDQSSESVKRERTSRINDSGSGFVRTESSLKSEITKITERGGLVDPAGVERLVQLMLPERNEKKIDLVCRSLLAGVVAATDKFDCLSRFVQLRGLPVFDEWLQEIHKGKIGDSSSPKDNDRSVDDFLLILLRALDKLPVNLNSLQTCNIGKSVNHLRSHKNSEIGRKARSLVDTWKKRVEAEMDLKSGSNHGTSWPGRPRPSEVSHGSKYSGVSADAAKASASHPSKSVSVKIPPENSVKSATTSPSSTRSAPSPGTGVSVVNTGALHREVGLSRSFSSHRTAISEKLSQSTLTPEKTLDVPIAEVCSNKLIVKLPKRGRSPAQTVSGGSFEDPAASSSRAPSPVPSEKHDQFDRNMKEMNDTDANTETSPNNDLKHGSAVNDSTVSDGSPSVNAGDVHVSAVNDSSKVAEFVKPISPTLVDDVKTEQRHGSLHSSMDALIESCVRDSETNACLAGADDVGMNLLATVAADEISNLPVASPSVSKMSDSPMNANIIAENLTAGITDSLDVLPNEQAEPVAKDTTIVDSEKHISSGEGHLAAFENLKDSKPADLDENSDLEIEELQRLVDQCLENSDDGVDQADDSDSGVVRESKTDVTSKKTDRVADTTRTGSSTLSECKVLSTSQKTKSLAAEHLYSDVDGDCKKEEKLSSELVNKMGQGVSEFAKDFDQNVTLVADTAERVETSMPTECKAIIVSPKVDSLAVENSSSAVVGDNKKEQKHIDRKMGEDKEKNKCVIACVDSSAANGEVEHVKTLAPIVVSPKVAEDCSSRPNGSRVSVVADTDEAEECTSIARDVPSGSASEMKGRVEFDLNEGLDGDDTRNGNLNNLSGSLSLTPTPSQPSRLPSSITITAAAKGAFVPRDDLLRNKATVGWRGSAATSAFRPAEPRKVLSSVKQAKTFLDFDLNVPDDRVLEDLATNSSGGGLNLDLNKVHDPTDMNINTITHRISSSFQKPDLSSGGRRDFDLNDGPSVDDLNVESSSMSFSQHSRGGLTSQSHPMISGIRMNGENMAGGFSSWFPASNNYPAMSIPQGNEHPYQVTSNGTQRMVGTTSFAHPDMYRGPVLLSSPAVSFPAQYPFGAASFPIPSANYQAASSTYMDSRLCFPHVNSQIMGQGVAMAPSNYPRPYGGGVSDKKETKWLRPSGLDLNTGPGQGGGGGGGHEAEETQRQLLSSSSSSSSAYGLLPLRDDEARMYQMSGGVLKRKEPDGGWDGYKQPSTWQ